MTSFSIKGSLFPIQAYYSILQASVNSSTEINIGLSDIFVNWNNSILPSLKYEKILEMDKQNIFQSKTSNVRITVSFLSQITDFLSEMTLTANIVLNDNTKYNLQIITRGTCEFECFTGYANNLNNIPQYITLFFQFTNPLSSLYYIKVDYEININLNIVCDPTSDNMFCNLLCSCVKGNNLDTCNQCYDTYKSYCFRTVNNFNNKCFNFFQNYIFYEGPNQDLDALFYNFCNQKYQNQNLQVKVSDPLCACHLDDSVYIDLLTKLSERFTNIAKIYDKKYRCVLPQCANSNFPHSSIGITKCQGVRCINIVEIEGNNIDYDKIQINQSGECINITNVPPV